MTDDEDERAEEAEARYQRVEATLREDAAADPAKSMRRAALGWLLFLVVIAGLAAIAWPKIRASIGPGNEASAAGSPSGLPLAQAPGAASRPKPSTRDYPPCTATRTDRCVQKDGK